MPQAAGSSFQCWRRRPEPHEQRADRKADPNSGGRGEKTVNETEKEPLHRGDRRAS
jgi:hypothetical protein